MTWQTMDTAPRDGTFVELVNMDLNVGPRTMQWTGKRWETDVRRRHLRAALVHLVPAGRRLMTGLFPLTAADVLAELDREIAVRRQLFPKWIDQGKMKPDVADHRIACLVEARRIITEASA